MTIVTNTQTKYDVVNIREDLSDIIYNISPTDTPFLTAIGKGPAAKTPTTSGRPTNWRRRLRPMRSSKATTSRPPMP